MKPLPLNLIDHADVRLAPYADLRHAGTRSDGPFFIAEGRWLVQRLIGSDYGVESVLVQQGFDLQSMVGLDPATAIYSLPREQMKDLVGFDFHRGVMACGRRIPLKSVAEFRFQPDAIPLALAVIGVTELENLGSLFRSAAGFGVRNVLIGPATADPFARRVIRVSMGNVFPLRLYRMNDPIVQLDELMQRMNLRCIATTLDRTAMPLGDFVADDRPTLLIVGSESDGLDQRLQQAATDRVTMAMNLGTDSLNVSVAAAVFMHHILHCQSQANPPSVPE